MNKKNKPSSKLPKCKTCYGHGMWPDGTAPMGPSDASEGMPTAACPECGANPNPVKTKKGKTMRIALLLLLSLCSFAAEPSLNTSGLTPAQVAEIQHAIDNTKRTNMATTIREETGAWAELGCNIGKAVTSAAKEVGVAAADFASTPLGKVLVCVLVLKFLGAPIFGILFGLLILTITVYLWSSRTKRVLSMVKYENKPVLFGLWNRRFVTDKKWESSDYNEEGSAALLGIGTLAALAFVASGLAHL